MIVQTSKFCGLAHAKDWQRWLQLTDEGLYDELMDTIKGRKGCRTNKEKMMEIYYKLYKRGKGMTFEDLIRRRFAYIITSDEDPGIPNMRLAPVDTAPQLDSDSSELNKHGVFRSYRPNILTFPQKYVIKGSGERLVEQVKSFVMDKIGVDYIVIEDRAYIEYFDRRFESEVDKVPPEMREIYVYRKTH